MDQNQKTNPQPPTPDPAVNTIQGDEINLLDHLKVLVTWRWFIVKTVCLIGVLSAIVSLLLPLGYTATTSILPSDDNSSGSGLGALLSDNPIASFALGNLGGGQLSWEFRTTVGMNLGSDIPGKLGGDVMT